MIYLSLLFGDDYKMLFGHVSQRPQRSLSPAKLALLIHAGAARIKGEGVERTAGLLGACRQDDSWVG